MFHYCVWYELTWIRRYFGLYVVQFNWFEMFCCSYKDVLKLNIACRPGTVFIWWLHWSKDFEAMNSGNLAIRTWLVCQYNENKLMDLPVFCVARLYARTAKIPEYIKWSKLYIFPHCVVWLGRRWLQVGMRIKESDCWRHSQFWRSIAFAITLQENDLVIQTECRIKPLSKLKLG